jgi:hypothetical protein
MKDEFYDLILSLVELQSLNVLIITVCKPLFDFVYIYGGIIWLSSGIVILSYKDEGWW